MTLNKQEVKYTLSLIIGKLEFDGSEMSNFKLLDRAEIVPFNKLESKLTRFYKNGLEKIKEVEKENWGNK